MVSKIAPLCFAVTLVPAAFAIGAVPAMAQPATASSLAIDHVDMKPTADGFYDATVGFATTDAKLGKTGRVAFSIVVPHVHDVDEAIDKVHDPIKTFAEDVRRGYQDIRRTP